MARTRTEPGLVDDLISHLFEGLPDDPLRTEVSGWLTASPRFRAFVRAHRDKLRKKLRGATEAEARRDVRAELRVAHLLIADRRIDLTFEPHGAIKGGPDFTVAFAGERPFNLEVTRLHGASVATVHGGPLLAKLRQLPPSIPNALLVIVGADGGAAFDPDAATRALLARAEVKDEEFFATREFSGSRGFYQRYLRLGAVIVWTEAATGSVGVSTWTNRSARIAIPQRALRACLARLAAG